MQNTRKKLNIKLLKRFWQAIEMYNYGDTYQQVFQAPIGTKQT
jgi:hypothetical protein